MPDIFFIILEASPSLPFARFVKFSFAFLIPGILLLKPSIILEASPKLPFARFAKFSFAFSIPGILSVNPFIIFVTPSLASWTFPIFPFADNPVIKLATPSLAFLVPSIKFCFAVSFLFFIFSVISSVN